MFDAIKNFFSRIPLSRSSLSLIGLFVVLAAIPLTVFIAQEQQEIRQMAAEANPTCTLSLQGGIDRGTVPFSTAVGAQISPITSGQIKGYQWDFGDGTAKEPPTGPGEITAGQIGGGSAVFQRHTYLRAGTFQITASYKGNPPIPDFSCSKTVTVEAIAIPPGIPTTPGAATSPATAPPTSTPIPPTATPPTTTPPALPDLTVESLTLNPSPFSLGQNVRISVVVKNLGAPTQSSYTQLSVDNTVVSGVQTRALSQNSQETILLNWAATDGTHTLKVCADGQGNITESNENNNCLEQSTAPGATPAVPPAAGATTLEVAFKLQGVTIPRRSTRRQVKVEVFNTSNTEVKNGEISATFQNGIFKGTFDLGTFTPGPYIVKLKVNNTLRKRVQEVTNIQTGRNTLEEITLISGDLNNDNELGAVGDYTILIGCLDIKRTTGGYSCSNSSLADLNDDGTVNGLDLNILINNFSHRTGD